MTIRQIAAGFGLATCLAFPSAAQDESSDQSAPAQVEQTEDTTAITTTEVPEEQAQDSLRVYFDTGRFHIGAEQAAVLDQAARLFREGQPYVMVLSGAADRVGAPESNLDLSLNRARAVADGLEARGIPVGRLQVLGRGNTDLPVDTSDGVAERENRVVEITWR